MIQMQQQFNPATSTSRVIARLQAEGWVECPRLGFPALGQNPMANMKAFILVQLQNAGGWMSQRDLKLSALIFSVPAHQFEVHPHLQSMLRHLEAEGTIQIRSLHRQTEERTETDAVVRLVRANLSWSVA